jgi:hypothetical protein
MASAPIKQLGRTALAHTALGHTAADCDGSAALI